MQKVIPIHPVGAVAASDKIHVRAIGGTFSRWRWTLVWLTQAFFYGVPWLNWHSRQAVLFDLEAKRFYLFGAVLFPQDLIYLTGLLVVSALLLFFATVPAGKAAAEDQLIAMSPRFALRPAALICEMAPLSLYDVG